MNLNTNSNLIRLIKKKLHIVNKTELIKILKIIQYSLLANYFDIFFKKFSVELHKFNNHNCTKFILFNYNFYKLDYVIYLKLNHNKTE